MRIKTKSIVAMFMTLLLVFVMIVLYSFDPKNDFITEQKKFERVRHAHIEKHSAIESKLLELGLKTEDLNILLVAIKDEDVLELYAKKKSTSIYSRLQTYKICARSGNLGPKRKEGDNQVPEGFYHIDRFNPNSTYYLSLGINYPNKSDQLKSTAKKLGGDIFIHGYCVTIGCLPMTNEKIKEIYLYAAHARNNGQTKIPVYVFPFRMNDQNFKVYKEKYADDPAMVNFWSNLKKGYDKFEKDKKELIVRVDGLGDYQF